MNATLGARARGGVGCAGGRKAYLDRGSGNSLGGALDLEGFDGSGDLCERHVECVVSEKKRNDE